MTPITLDEPEVYFDRLAAFEATHWWSAATWRVAEHWLGARLRGRTGLEAIDVGCGAGLTLQRLAARGEIGQVIGIDPSPEALGHARRRGYRVVEASATDLPFGAGSFDVATCLDVIQHLPQGDIASATRELARVLRPGGLAIVRTNAGQGGVDLEQLRARFESHGLQVLHASRVNFVGSLAQEVRGRLRPSMHRHHPRGGGLPRPHRRSATDPIMATLGRAEAFLVGGLGWALPFGHSAMVLAIRDHPTG
ncbi:MAG TPA: class I SAM-dependent methyltransferase [Isosphaeraceae bacterium]|jgi:SAM-dependent methyltransferase